MLIDACKGKIVLHIAFPNVKIVIVSLKLSRMLNTAGK